MRQTSVFTPPAWLRRLRSDCRGNSMVEFAVSLPFLVLLTVGSFAMGVVIDRHLTVTQLVRNGGNMYGRGVDFTIEQNKELLLKAAGHMQMTVNGGEGVIYLSTVTLATDGDNVGKPVVTHRVPIANTSLRNSAIAMPQTVLPNGDVDNYENDPNAVATLPPGLTLTANERVFVAEVFHRPIDLGFKGIFVPEGLYSAAYF